MEGTQMPDTTVAFIGLGTMGRPMAGRLLAVGYRLTVHDLLPEAVDALAAAGAGTARSARSAATGADVVITMLPNGPHVRAALSGPDGALAAMRPGGVLVDMSTIDPPTSRELAELAGRHGVRMLDAPVSGSSAGAADGSLTVMVGGDAATLAELRPLLGELGRTIVHCGGNGAGVSVKLANQIIAGTSMAAVAESYALARSLGVDPRLLFEVVSAGSGDCWALRTRPPVAGVLATSPAENDFRPGFKGILMCKDLDLALATAAAHAVDLPVTHRARELYARMSEEGLGERDFSAVFALLTKEE
ncbi:3-hydroxyisobutyrate dehydrogenase [Streptomyces yaizuensis]|uniref:3-hydroxyisobutyrate dehydrogenase n=2 Tax=Streptomyces yaizuensis TaxID=2989713 RepID=A0ABQ5NSU0_9ACTN|nr:3-hydroxyisobutyrate dehydrogenase [Streptomyces sp. YSPA8]